MRDYLALFISHDERVIGNSSIPAVDLPAAVRALKEHLLAASPAAGWEVWLGGELLAAEGARHALKRAFRKGRLKYLKPQI